MTNAINQLITLENPHGVFLVQLLSRMWHTCVVLVLGRLRQEGYLKCQTSLGYTARLISESRISPTAAYLQCACRHAVSWMLYLTRGHCLWLSDPWETLHVLFALWSIPEVVAAARLKPEHSPWWPDSLCQGVGFLQDVCDCFFR